MSEPEPPPTHQVPTRSTVSEVGHGIGWLLLQWVQETVMKWAVLAALVAILAGFAGGAGHGWLVAGLVIGVPGAVVPFVAAHRWPSPWSWLVPAAVLVISVGFTVALVASTS